ncbi:hypothetical protein FKM82_030599 [Ascaphus truei]
MPYLAHTANVQLAGFAFATVGWVLGSITTGLVQWRVWHVANSTIISSGIAWIGIWRTCFFSRVLVSPNLETMYCQVFSVKDSFVPPEIFVAQGLMLVAIFLGAAGKVTCAFGLKNIYQGTAPITVITHLFTAGGIFNLFAGVCIIIPTAWNLHSVVNNFSIDFPSTFHMPSRPERQEVGAAIAIGILSAILLLMSGVLFLHYRQPVIFDPKVHPILVVEDRCSDCWSITTNPKSYISARSSVDHIPNCGGITNEAFELDEKL